PRTRQHDIDASFHQIGRMALHPLRQQRETSRIDYKILTFDEAEPPHFIKQGEIMPCIARARKQAAEAINASGLLAVRCEGPCRRAAQQRDELAAPHSITSSAATSSLSGTVRPSILAVWALITNSNFVDCRTGKSAGFAPLRMRPA